MGPLNVSSISRRHGPRSVVHLAPQERRCPFPRLSDLSPSPLLDPRQARGPRGELIIANIYFGLVTARSGE